MQNTSSAVDSVAMLNEETSGGNEESNEESKDRILKWSIVGGLLVLLVSGTVAWLVFRRHHSLPFASCVEEKPDIEKGQAPAIPLPAAESVAQENCQDKISGSSTSIVEDTDSVEVAEVVVDLTTANEQGFSQLDYNKLAGQSQRGEASPAVSMQSTATVLDALEPLGPEEDPDKKAEGENGLVPNEKVPVAFAVPPERIGSLPALRELSVNETTCEPQGWPTFVFPRNWLGVSCSKPTTEEIQSISTSISRAPSLMDTHELSEQKSKDAQGSCQITAPGQSKPGYTLCEL